MWFHFFTSLLGPYKKETGIEGHRFKSNNMADLIKSKCVCAPGGVGEGPI